MGSFVRRVKTASGATAVQIVHKRGRDVVGIDHIGSAHDDAALALLLHAARERRHAGQQALELDLDTAPAADRSGRPVVEATGSLILWDALSSVYDALGFSAVRDEAFPALVLGRIIEPTSKVDTIRVLDELGVDSPSLSTIRRCVKRRRTRLPEHGRGRLLSPRDCGERAGSGALRRHESGETLAATRPLVAG